jgi:hypothetical protein
LDQRLPVKRYSFLTQRQRDIGASHLSVRRPGGAGQLSVNPPLELVCGQITGLEKRGNGFHMIDVNDVERAGDGLAGLKYLVPFKVLLTQFGQEGWSA